MILIKIKKRFHRTVYDFDKNIAFTNLRNNDAKIYDKDKTWRTVDILAEDLFETVTLYKKIVIY